MLKIDWSEADIVYAASICYPEKLMNGIAERMKLLKKGTRMITLKMFEGTKDWNITHNLRVKMTWGRTSVFILEKMS